MTTACDGNYSNLDQFRLLETHESTNVNLSICAVVQYGEACEKSAGLLRTLIDISDRALGLKF